MTGRCHGRQTPGRPFLPDLGDSSYHPRPTTRCAPENGPRHGTWVARPGFSRQTSPSRPPMRLPSERTQSSRACSRRTQVTFVDRTLTCVDCGVEFIHSAADQEYYVQKGFACDPKRCTSCRASRRAAAETAATRARSAARAATSGATTERRHLARYADSRCARVSARLAGGTSRRHEHAYAGRARHACSLRLLCGRHALARAAHAPSHPPRSLLRLRTLHPWLPAARQLAGDACTQARFERNPHPRGARAVAGTHPQRWPRVERAHSHRPSR